MRVKVRLELDIHDTDAVIAAGDRCIREDTGEESLSAFLGEARDTPFAHSVIVKQAVWEIIMHGMRETLGTDRNAMEFRDGGCHEV